MYSRRHPRPFLDVSHNSGQDAERPRSTAMDVTGDVDITDGDVDDHRTPLPVRASTRCSTDHRPGAVRQRFKKLLMVETRSISGSSLTTGRGRFPTSSTR